MIRKERLVSEPLLRLPIIMDEAVLPRKVGDRTTMRIQLERFADVTRLPNVDVRVLPRNGETALLARSIVIVSVGPRLH